MWGGAGVYTNFIYENGKLIARYLSNENESAAAQKVYFRYDKNGAPLSINYNGNEYFYVLNLQGDVIALIDNTGTVVVKYTYDSWGKLLSTTGSMGYSLGADNPLRYRGYYYDKETGLYYLQSRYYDPETGRFLNADSYLSTGQGLFGYNMFAYCGNNPVKRVDSTGDCWLTILAVTAVVLVCTFALTGCTSSHPTTRSDIVNSNTILDKSADELSSLDPYSYNCYGNGIGKQINTNPSGYKAGDSTEKTFKAVINDLGKDKVRRLDSIDSPIGNDEFRVAMKCGPSDYHFIRQLSDGTWYNKSGTTVGTYATIEDVTGDVWHAIFMYKGVRIIYPGEPVYDDETIYFAVKVWGD